MAIDNEYVTNVNTLTSSTNIYFAPIMQCFYIWHSKDLSNKIIKFDAKI